MVTYKRAEQAIASTKTWQYDLSQGIANAGLSLVNFVTAGYTPEPTNGTDLSDTSKGALLFSAKARGPQGNPVQIVVNGAFMPAIDVPLKLYVTADATEPYLRYTCTQAVTLDCQIVYRRDGNPDQLCYWQEVWT